MAKERMVLVVDDKQGPRDEIARAFEMDEEFDFKVEKAASEKEAIEILKRQERRYDVVTIDWMFPSSKDGGLEVLNFLNNLKLYLPKVKIVYTAYPSIKNCVKAMKAGADNYIEKTDPTKSLKELLESVKEELRSRKSDENEPDPNWLKEHFDELMQKHRGELIAFIDGKLVGHASTKRKLLEELKERYPNEEPFIMFAPEQI